jgi:hypothetical protein
MIGALNDTEAGQKTLAGHDALQQDLFGIAQPGFLRAIRHRLPLALLCLT